MSLIVADCFVSVVKPVTERVSSWKDGEETKVEHRAIGWQIDFTRKGEAVPIYRAITKNKPDYSVGDPVQIVVQPGREL